MDEPTLYVLIFWEETPIPRSTENVGCYGVYEKLQDAQFALELLEGLYESIPSERTDLSLIIYPEGKRAY